MLSGIMKFVLGWFLGSSENLITLSVCFHIYLHHHAAYSITSNLHLSAFSVSVLQPLATLH
jgi:hypothetical protein